jgi:hypothetical protein
MCSYRLLLLKRWFNLIFFLSFLRYKVAKSFILKNLGFYKGCFKIQIKFLKLMSLYMSDWAGYSLKFAKRVF